MENKVNALLDEIFSGDPKETYNLDTSGLDEEVKAQAAAVAAKWDVKQMCIRDIAYRPPSSSL